jgi:DNA-binding transcriptional MerR regulator
LTKRAIRYYEEIGVLPPPERSAGGYRLYSDKHIERLKQIINARDVLGVSLQELQEYLSIIEAIRLQRQGIREVEDEEMRREKLAAMEQSVAKLMDVIDRKLEKLTALRKEVKELQDRVREASQKGKPTERE